MENVRTLPGMQGTRALRSKTGRFKFIPRLGDDSYRRLLWKVEKYALWRALIVVKQKKRKKQDTMKVPTQNF